MPTFTAAQQTFVDTTVAKIKAEILEHFDDGTDPGSITCFADLDNYMDANSLGGMCDDDTDLASIFPDPEGSPDHGTINSQAGMDALEHITNLVDAWLRGGPVWPGFEHEGTQIVNPTCSDCSRFPVSPQQYGFEHIETGGGCKAWARKLPDGTQCMITDLGGISTDLTPGETYLLGIYDADDGAELAMYEGTVGVADVLRKCPTA